MSKARHNWYGYVQNMIRDYPRYCAQLDALHQQSVTANYSGMPRGGAASRTTEAIALRELSETEQHQYDSVRLAIEQTKNMPDGEDRLRMVSMVFWKRSHTLGGAAMVLNVSFSTAKRWKKSFVNSVANFYGLFR